MSRQISNLKRVVKKNSRRKTSIKRAISMFSVLAMIVLCGFTYSANAVAGNQKEEKIYTYYDAIRIQDGDTLWSIANEYAPSTGLSVKEYIKEIKNINHLTTDRITADQYLSIFYCSSEYK